MSDFINTVDVVGDEALTDSILTGTITEYVDNQVEKIGNGAFMGCKSLVNVNVPNVTVFDDDAVRACTALETIDTAKLETIGMYAAYQCTNLKAFILRNTDKVCEAGVHIAASSGITSGTGYIYVPSALVDAYKAAKVWSNYADQIRAIEDYPEVCG